MLNFKNFFKSLNFNDKESRESVYFFYFKKFFFSFVYHDIS